MMHWQDTYPVRALVDAGLTRPGAYITVARVGPDRKESQIGSRPVDQADAAWAWLCDVAADAAGPDGNAHLRVRLWARDRTPLRSVSTRVWRETSVLHDAPTPAPTATTAIPSAQPGRPRFVFRRHAMAAAPTAPPIELQAGAAVAVAPAPNAQPIQPPPPPFCLTCASASSTIGQLRAENTELATRLARSQALRVEDAEDLRGALGRVAKLKAENAELSEALESWQEAAERAQALLDDMLGDED